MDETRKEVTREQLMSEISNVLANAQTLLRDAASATGDRAVELRRNAEDAISNAVKKLVEPLARRASTRPADDLAFDRGRPLA